MNSKGISVQIVVNAEQLQLEKEMTLEAFIREKGINPLTIAIEYNYTIVKKEVWNTITLCEGDNLEIVTFVGGGK